MDDCGGEGRQDGNRDWGADAGQGLGGAVAYAKHAAKNGADAICSLPPEGDNAAVMEYYKAIGAATDLPLFVQTIGDEPVDLVVEMYKGDPDDQGGEGRGGRSAEAGEASSREDGRQAGGVCGQGRAADDGRDAAWLYGFLPDGGDGRCVPAIVGAVRGGQMRESFDMFGRIQAFSTITDADRYVMVARGIFKEDTKSRPTPGMGSGGGREARAVRAGR